jgi:hypothetical protein
MKASVAKHVQFASHQPHADDYGTVRYHGNGSPLWQNTLGLVQLEDSATLSTLFSAKESELTIN